MIHLLATLDDVGIAWGRSEKMGHLHNSITKGAGNMAGFIGEQVLSRYLDCSVQDTFEYDLIYKDSRIDVKTKRCTSAPKPQYFCSVADYNTNQDCDYYAFLRVMDLRDVWILGYMGKSEFYSKATFNKAGEYDESSTPAYPFYFKADCYNIKASDLHSIDELKND